VPYFGHVDPADPPGSPVLPLRYAVSLLPAEREVLGDHLTGRTTLAGDLAHARILLKADEGAGGPA